MKYKIKPNRKDNAVVTICRVKSITQICSLHYLYVEANDYRLLAESRYGFTATNGIEKIICYKTGGKRNGKT